MIGYNVKKWLTFLYWKLWNNYMMMSFKNFYQQSMYTEMPQTYSVYTGKLQMVNIYRHEQKSPYDKLSYCLRSQVVLGSASNLC